MKAMIFAAGLGTRLKPITDSMPKALVPVCGQPLLYHVITKLVAGGYDDLVVNVHHFPDQIIHYLHSHDFGARIAVSDERDFLRETGGGIKYARPLLDFSTPPTAPLEMTESLSFRPSEARGEIYQVVAGAAPGECLGYGGGERTEDAAVSAVR